MNEYKIETTLAGQNRPDGNPWEIQVFDKRAEKRSRVEICAEVPILNDQGVAYRTEYVNSLEIDVEKEGDPLGANPIAEKAQILAKLDKARKAKQTAHDEWKADVAREYNQNMQEALAARQKIEELSK